MQCSTPAVYLMTPEPPSPLYPLFGRFDCSQCKPLCSNTKQGKVKMFRKTSFLLLINFAEQYWTALQYLANLMRNYVYKTGIILTGMTSVLFRGCQCCPIYWILLQLLSKVGSIYKTHATRFL